MTYALGHELKFAAISASSSGDNTLVSAVTSQKIKVIGYVLVAAGAVSAKFKSGASTDLSGAMPLAANGGISAPATAESVELETAAGSALVLNLSGAVLVAGYLSYIAEAS